MRGIYKITNTKNGKVYIGQSSNVLTRWRTHIFHLSRNKHTNAQLQADWDPEFFVFEVLEETADSSRESYWLSQHSDTYNIVSGIQHRDPVVDIQTDVVYTVDDLSDFKRACKPYIYSLILEKYCLFVDGKYQFTKDERNSGNCKLIDEYYKTFGCFTPDSSYAKFRLSRDKSLASRDVVSKVRASFSIGKRYPNKEVRAILQEIYDANGIERKAKPRDLYEYFSEVVNKKVRGENYQEIIRR